MNKNTMIGLGVIVILAGGFILFSGPGDDAVVDNADLLGDETSIPANFFGEGSDPFMGNTDGVFPFIAGDDFVPGGGFRVLEVREQINDNVITGGYLFPVGPNGPRKGHPALKAGCEDYLRPLIIQFTDDLGRSDLTDVVAEIVALSFATESTFINVPSTPQPVFDSINDFTAIDDGIDLLYFGTVDRTVGLEWPPSDTVVTDGALNDYGNYDDVELNLVVVEDISFNCDIPEIETQHLTGMVEITPLNVDGDPIMNIDGDEIRGILPIELFVFDEDDYDIFADGFESGDTSVWSNQLP